MGRPSGRSPAGWLDNLSDGLLDGVKVDWADDWPADGFGLRRGKHLWFMDELKRSLSTVPIAPDLGEAYDGANKDQEHRDHTARQSHGHIYIILSSMITSSRQQARQLGNICSSRSWLRCVLSSSRDHAHVPIIIIFELHETGWHTRFLGL
ncbi:hypothetical protein A0H81_07244 [Grifola frondosa]|uniref:Uncharacterized protein n=1 Tax=Grifola frondosa TaxID=5627 RepID=A0A1C7M8A5_GRIFR|nr:hypothetical protein A0H81_07244 [Grifola frondosa]